MVLYFIQVLNTGHHKWIVLSVIVFIIIALYKDFLRPSAVLLSSTVIFILLGIITPAKFLSNFSNRSIVTIILLILITSALRKNYQLDVLLDRIFSKAKTSKGFLWRMGGFVSFLSSCLNNTPIVAIMTPYVYNWSKKYGVHPSKLLIPLSYFTILGGMITLIGTSTNLVLNGFLYENNLPSLHFTDFLYLGILVTISGLIYIYTLGYRLLPERKDAFDDIVKAKAPEYVFEVCVEKGSKIDGQSIRTAGLLALEGVYLIEIHKENGEHKTSFENDEVIVGGDILIFMGKSETIMNLVLHGVGLTLQQHEEQPKIIEAVVPDNSAIAGMQVKNTYYNSDSARIIAIHRNGAKLSGKIEELNINHGDLLLMSVTEAFLENKTYARDVYILSTFAKNKKETNVPSRTQLKSFPGVFIGVVICGFCGIFSLFTGVLTIFTFLFAFSLFKVEDFRKELDIDLVIVLGCTLNISSALIDSGAADVIAGYFTNTLEPFGAVGMLIGLFVLTVLLSSFITNVAAVSMVFPIAYSLITDLSLLNSTPFFVAIAFAASAAFISPISYQTNWMVYGPGSYTTKDFFRVGFPLTIIYAIVCITFIILRYKI